jgi:prepilin signal peptidase PulO-like enzyme (type II secretory pathway)
VEENVMKKVTLNFWMNILIFVDFILMIFTGILLHRFPAQLQESTILGVPRYDWGDLHWVLCLLFITLIIVHLVLHWKWTKVSCRKYLKVGPKSLLIIIIVIVILFGIFLPTYLTKDFPDKKTLRGNHPHVSSVELTKKDKMYQIQP